MAATQNPCYSPAADDPRGVPLAAIVFGGRRRSVAPLVYEARDWAHGVLVGASVASETTAAAIGEVGVVRRDPMAMKPFCGYNFADYWSHWLSIGTRLTQPPRIFHVNWFRRDAAGNFLWPGYGENLRVIAWMLARCGGKANGRDTAIGYLPDAADLNLQGLSVSGQAMTELLAVDNNAWRAEAADIRQYVAEFGTRVPAGLNAEISKLAQRLA